MTLDLDMFKVNLLAMIHLFIALISPFILYFKLDMLSSCKTGHVSSAYSLGAELMELLMSLMYSVKSRGPRTDPKGALDLMYL